MAAFDESVLVDGFIRHIIAFIGDSAQNNNFPNTIIDLCLIYYKTIVFNGKNCGEWTWQIDNSQGMIDSILNAQDGCCLESKLFKIANLSWTLKIYPNGFKSHRSSYGSFLFYLHLVSMPKHIETVVLSRNFFCNQTMSSHTLTRKYTNSSKTWGWYSKTLLLQELKDLEPLMLTFSIQLKILKLKLFHNKHSYCNPLLALSLPTNDNIYPMKTKVKHIFKVNEYTMNMFKNSYYGKKYESVDRMDNIWRLVWYPCGETVVNEGYMSVFLLMSYMPYPTNTINVKYSITCKELNYTVDCEDEFNYEKQKNGCSKFATVSEYKNLEMLTFIVNLEILHRWHLGTNKYIVDKENQIEYVLKK
eukprot:344547_1